MSTGQAGDRETSGRLSTEEEEGKGLSGEAWPGWKAAKGHQVALEWAS